MPTPTPFFALLVLLACDRAPTAETEVRQLLTDLQTGKDQPALDALRLPHDAPPIDATGLGKRADRLPLLRTHDRVEITSVDQIVQPPRPRPPLDRVAVRAIQNANPVHEVRGVLWRGSESADFEARVHRDGISGVEVRGLRLIPVPTYVIVPAPPPLPEPPQLRDIQVNWRPIGEHTLVQVAGALKAPHTPAAASVQTLCREGDRFYRHETTGQARGEPDWLELNLSDRVGTPRPSICQVRLAAFTPQERHIRWCLEGDGSFAVGPCPDQPAPGRTGPGPVTIDEVRAEIATDGATIHYTLHPNEPQPAHTDWLESASLETELTCASGVAKRHGRPLNSDNDEPGVHRRYGSVLGVDQALALPCTVRLRYVRDDHFDRTDVVAFEQCWDGAAWTSGACT